MRAFLLAFPLILAGCAEPGGLSFQGRPLSLTGAFERLNDASYSAGARTGERLGLSPAAETPRCDPKNYSAVAEIFLPGFRDMASPGGLWWDREDAIPSALEGRFRSVRSRLNASLGPE